MLFFFRQLASSIKKTFEVLLIGLVLPCVVSFGQDKAAKPNILWITCEDMGTHLGSYGNKLVKTPNLDKLASEGIRYTNAFATAGVCAPSRSAIITGMYQQSIGTQHMRTHKYPGNPNAYPPGYIGYDAVVPEYVRCFPEYLRAAGYYCTNNVKQDYQFEAPVTVWDESTNKAHWRNRKNDAQPFFSIFNFTTTHESQVWVRANEKLLVDPAEVEVPPYYPDVPEVRQDIARHLSNVMVMDAQAGEILKQLEEDGLADNTIVFFYSDHGDGLPFVKREIYDRGIRVPLIIRFGKNWRHLEPRPAGATDEQLVSLVDLAPTMLSLTGIDIPGHLQGQAFLGSKKASPRKYVFAARDRMDSEYDRVRCVTDGRFMYLRNYMPELPYYQKIEYRLQQPSMKAILKLKDEGRLNDAQMLWFRTTKPAEEFFDRASDPHHLKNLAGDTKVRAKMSELREAFDAWIKETGDFSDQPESSMVKNWWFGKEEPPKTSNPELTMDGRIVSITSKTPGASIGYRTNPDESWKVYKSPFAVESGRSLEVVAQRIGYTKSDTIRITIRN